MMRHKLGWHFTNLEGTLRYGDGRQVVPGETLTVEGPIVLCGHGLHDSISALDALTYAPGPRVWRTRLGGEIRWDCEKRAASERTALWGYDATEVLQRFARLCALDVIDLWDAPDEVKQALRQGTQCPWVHDPAHPAARAAFWALKDPTMRNICNAVEAARLATWKFEYTTRLNRRLHRMLMEGRPR